MTEQFQMTRRTILGGAAFAGVLTPIIAASMAHAESSATETNAAATAADIAKLERVKVELVKPPSITTTSPVTNCMPVMRFKMTSPTSSAVTQRLRGVALARPPIKVSYLSPSMRSIHSPSIHPGATALTRMSGPKFQASILVRLTTAALLAA